MNIYDFWSRLKVAMMNYFKGLLILSLLTFIVLSIGLNLIGISFWGLKAFFITIVDIFPVLGSGTVMIPWAIIRALSGSTDIGAYIAILYVLIVVIRFIAEPLIIGKNVGVSPFLTLVITIVSIMIFGPVGAIIGGLLTVPLKVIWEFTSGKSAIGGGEGQ